MPTLYDMIVRHAFYFEGARRKSAQDFARIVRSLDAEVMRRFQRISVKNFGEMTKAEFNQFMARLRSELNGVFVKEGRKFEQTMRQLSDIETSIYQRIFRNNTGERIRVNKETVWSKTKNRDIGATGGNMTRAARQYRNASINAIERIVRQGYADKKAVQEVLTNIRGLKSLGYKNGVLSQIAAWGDSYFNTTFQHVGQSVKDDLAEAYYEEYIWLSTLDEVTTDICRERHLNRYKYGEGPIPPAHYNCRSETVPADPEGAAFPSSFNKWLRDQPNEFTSDAFHKGTRPGLDTVRLITLDKLGDKLSAIMAD